MPTILDKLITVLAFDTDLRDLRKFEGAVDAARKKMDSVGSGAIRLGAGLTAVGGAATAGFAAAVKTAIEWEDAFTGVLKTVDGSDAELGALEMRLRQMAAQEIPLPVEDLAAIAEAAGQLGIETSNIVGFTETMAQLGVTTNLAADQAAMDLARLANNTGMSQDDFDRTRSNGCLLGQQL